MSNSSRTPATPLSHETIAADIAAFRKRGGRIEVLGDTPVRSVHVSPFRSRQGAEKSQGSARTTASR